MATTEWRSLMKYESGALAAEPDLVGYINEMGKPVIIKMTPTMIETCHSGGLNLIFSKPVMDAVRRLS